MAPPPARADPRPWPTPPLTPPAPHRPSAVPQSLPPRAPRRPTVSSAAFEDSGRLRDVQRTRLPPHTARLHTPARHNTGPGRLPKPCPGGGSGGVSTAVPGRGCPPAGPRASRRGVAAAPHIVTKTGKLEHEVASPQARFTHRLYLLLPHAPALRPLKCWPQQQVSLMSGCGQV